MADNIEVVPGVLVATDEVAGVHHQRTKLSIGADGEAHDLDAGQALKAVSIPVVIASDQDPLDVSGPLTDTELRASAVKISLDGEAVSLAAGANNIGDVDVASLPSLPVGDNFVGRVATPVTTADADFTQVITVSLPGTPVQGPNVSNANGWCLHASPLMAATNVVYFMYHGQTAAAKGFPLGISQLVYTGIQNLSDLDFDATAGGLNIYAYKC